MRRRSFERSKRRGSPSRTFGGSSRFREGVALGKDGDLQLVIKCVKIVENIDCSGAICTCLSDSGKIVLNRWQRFFCLFSKERKVSNERTHKGIDSK